MGYTQHLLHEHKWFASYPGPRAYTSGRPCCVTAYKLTDISN